MKSIHCTVLFSVFLSLHMVPGWAKSGIVPDKEVIGFANSSVFVASPLDETVQVHSHNTLKLIRTVPITPNLGERLIACQKYQSEQVLVIAMLLEQGKLHFQDDTRLTSVPFPAERLIAGLCGNLDADIAPDTVLLSETKGKYMLHLVRQSDYEDQNSWQSLTLDLAPGNYTLRAEFSLSSAQSITILDDDHQLVQQIFAHQFLPGFKYQKKDFSTSWQQYTGMNRGAAKLLWNAGARSLAKLDLYVRSVSEPIDFHDTKAEKKVGSILTNLSVNQSQQAVRDLTQVYINWKRGSNY
ncbi:hypothetical protein [Pseudoalteromonas rubra]|uniref:DUF2057 domain-containing protein n=1 Tax=Pseudoalteromonas rubra TaxID=43658 RepID=A0A0F4QPS0_9GAMM|nr:hypothetical protein [Pseudoalteromonas rubra]KJZ09661.1 hypothetical protein TW77_09200 [Pseudoalteromonas rubra]